MSELTGRTEIIPRRLNGLKVVDPTNKPSILRRPRPTDSASILVNLDTLPPTSTKQSPPTSLSRTTAVVAFGIGVAAALMGNGEADRTDQVAASSGHKQDENVATASMHAAERNALVSNVRGTDSSHQKDSVFDRNKDTVPYARHSAQGRERGPQKGAER
ncbi:MAG: hypothetical protein AAB553_03930 [Patescibacteria group bacterium]